MPGAFLFDQAKTISERHGIRFTVEPAFGPAGQLVYPSGKVRYIRRNILDLNSSTASGFARSRSWSLPFLADGGFAVVDFRCFGGRSDRSRAIGRAEEYAKILGYPVVVKTSRQCGGQGVHLATGPDSLPALIRAVLALDRDFLVQRALFGAQLSVVVLDGTAVLAYAAGPPEVTGDGRRTVQALIEDHLAAARAADWPVALDAGDARLDEYLSYRGRSRDQIPEAGERLRLSILTGPAYGGPLADASAAIPDDVGAAAVAAAAYAGLRFCRVEFTLLPASDGDVGPWRILDLLDAPDLELYAGLGPGHLARVAGILEQVILKMDQE